MPFTLTRIPLHLLFLPVLTIKSNPTSSSVQNSHPQATKQNMFTFETCCSLVTQSCPTLCKPMDCSMAGFPFLHYLFACSNSYPLSQWCHPTVSSSVATLSSYPQSFPASGSFLMSQFFTSGGQSIGASASAPVLLMNTQGCFSLGLTGVISLQSKGLPRVFFNTTVRNHQFFSAQPSLWSNSHIHIWLLEKP